MSLSVLKNKKAYTYGDYLNWPYELRCELIEGEIYDMSPAPLRRHQKVAVELLTQIAVFLRDKTCEVYISPFDVRLPEKDEADSEITTVVQPDISVICDPTKLDERGCKGAPDFIAEILSPSTAAKDQIQKTALYEKHGVKEYWLIHPIDKLLTVRLLGADGKYGIPAIYEGKGRRAIAVLPELEIDLDAVFRE
jgi:Uma2 family endonuclease